MFSNLLYYGSHSVVNQIRKLFKTWLLILILVCFAFGMIIGFTASKIDEKAAAEETVVEVSEDEDFSIFADMDKTAVFELAAGAVIASLLVLLVWTSTEKGINLFLPADVNIMFTSPMPPQSVLMFRVMCQMGLYIFLAVYFMIEIPALKSLFELSTLASAMVVLAFAATLAAGTFLSIFLSLLASKHKIINNIIKYTLLGLIGACALGFVVYWKSGSMEIMEAALWFFNSKYVLFIPIIGWIKGMVVFAIEEKLVYSIVCLLAVVVLIALIIILTKNIKVDFYEEAMIKSEEVAELAAKMKEKGSLFVKGKKSDKDIQKEKKLIRNRLDYGEGAAMFLVRSLYNRFRFAKLHVITKTLITYLFVSAAASLIAIKAEAYSLFIPAGAVSVFVFLRTMGNPMREDTENIYFLLAPANGWSKLIYSTLGGSINCLLDVLPGLILAAVLLKASLLELLGCLVFIVTLDYFSTCIGTFVNVSLPQNAGATVKQVLQILFLYFGLLPDVLIIVFGMLAGYSTSGVVALTAVINVALGLVFQSLIVPLIVPGGGIKNFAGNVNVDLKKVRKVFSSAGSMMFITYAIAFAIQIFAVRFIQTNGAASEIKGVLIYVLNFVPIYLIGLPVGYLAAGNRERKAPVRESLKPVSFIKLIPSMCFLVFAGNLAGSVLSLFFSVLSGTDFVNPTAAILEDQSLAVQIVFVALIGPLLEELLFRKIIIDRLNQYGEKLAIIFSAVVFGLFHGNVTQGVYAALLGLLLGYVYTRTGSLKYSFALHAGLNLFNGILPTYVLSNVEFAALDAFTTVKDLVASDSFESLTALGVYYLVEIVLAITGLIIVCSERRNLVFKRAENELIKGERFKTAFLNPGFICFTLLMVFLIVNDYVGAVSWGLVP